MRFCPERKQASDSGRLSFDCEVKLAGDGTAAGTITGYGSVFGVLDRGGDIVHPGAFKASLSDWRRKKQLPPMLWQHDSWQPVGIWTDIEEDEKGLRLTGELILDVPQASAAHALVKAGAVRGLSIGYRTRKEDIDRATGVRHLKQVDLWEVSLVTFPMLPEAQISGVKDLDPRALESQLRRDLNLSSGAAVKAVAIVKQHLRDGGGQPEDDARDGVKDVLLSLRRAKMALR